MFCQSFPNLITRLLRYTSLRTVLCGTRLVGLWSTYLEQEPPLVAGTLACFQHPPGGYTAPRVSARPMGSANLTTGLVRTLWLSETDLHRAPVLKTSSKSGLPIAWITGYATIPQPGIMSYERLFLMDVMIFSHSSD